MEYFMMRNTIDKQNKPNKSNFQTILSKYKNIIENKISKSDVIQLTIIDELVSEIKKEVEEYNTKINEFYDDKYYNDLIKFLKQISDSENKSLIYEEKNYIKIR